MCNNIVTNELHVLVLPNCRRSAYNRCNVYIVRELTKICSSWVIICYTLNIDVFEGSFY